METSSRPGELIDLAGKKAQYDEYARKTLARREYLAPILRMMDVLFSDIMSEQEKKGILDGEFGVPMTEVVDEEVVNMCNFSEGIYQHGVTAGKVAGIAEGEAKGFAKSVYNLMKSAQKSLDEAINMLGVSDEDRPTVVDQVNAMTAAGIYTNKQ